MTKEESTNDKLQFDHLDLSNEIKKTIADMGFEEPTPIQFQSIPFLLEGKDLIGQAQTGTGKTAAYGIPITEMTETSKKHSQTLILCPTRELAIQIAEDLVHISKHKKNIRILPIYGGQSIELQIRALKSGVHVVIGTPGRILDHLNRGTLKLNTIKMVVLDEADEMLDMGFRDDIETILDQTPEERQTVMFSATMAPQILALADKYLNNPEHIVISHKELTVPNTEQVYYEVREKEKLEVLSNLLQINEPKLSLIFCNTKIRVDDLVEKLIARGFLADGLHGNLRQAQRDRVMNKFRKAEIDILVATDVAARGLDVDDIEAVFNYDMPQDEEYYVHRIGRTGRAGKTGIAFSLVTGKEINKLKDIKKYTNAHIVRKEVPRAMEVEEMKINNYFQRVKDTIDAGHLSDYIYKIEYLLSEDFTALEIAAAMLKLTIVSEQTSQPAPEEKQFAPKKSENTNVPKQKNGMVRMFINIGKKQNIGAGDILGAICGEASLDNSEIGKIDLLENFSFFEVTEESVDKVLEAMQDNQIRGKAVSVEVAKERREQGDRREYGERKEYGDRREHGERKEYGDRREHGERKEYGGRREKSDKRDFNSGFAKKDRFGNENRRESSKKHDRRDRSEHSSGKDFGGSKGNRSKSQGGFKKKNRNWNSL